MHDEVDHQAVRDAVLFWREHRHEPRPALQPGTEVGYLPVSLRGAPLLIGRVGHVMQVLPGNRRLVQFGGEEDGSEPVYLNAAFDHLLEL